jgi:uncharacterized membrane protein
MMKPGLSNLSGYLVASGLGLVLVAARLGVTRQFHFLFLPWNLFLAWLPLGFAWLTRRLAFGAPEHRWGAWLAGLAWLLFLPNSPYIFTDFVHLTGSRGTLAPPLWFDLVMTLLFALTGLLVGLRSVALMHGLVQDLRGPRAGWLFVAGSLLLSGFGVYLGRFLRWNSWDLFSSPMLLLGDVADRVINPLSDVRGYAFSLLFGTMLFLVYAMARGVTRPPDRG